MLRFKNSDYKETTLKNRLKSFYKLATKQEILNGLNWYRYEHEYLKGIAEGANIEFFKLVGIFAALSPQMSVDRNKKLLLQYLKHGDASHYKVLIDKCDKIKGAHNESEVAKILNGTKITSFYWNLLKPENVTRVTIDRHALASMLQTPSKVNALDDGTYSMTRGQYKAFEKVYTDVAKEFYILPHQLQAIIWETYRRLRDLKQYEQVPF